MIDISELPPPPAFLLDVDSEDTTNDSETITITADVHGPPPASPPPVPSSSSTASDPVPLVDVQSEPREPIVDIVKLLSCTTHSTYTTTKTKPTSTRRRGSLKSKEQYKGQVTIKEALDAMKRKLTPEKEADNSQDNQKVSRNDDGTP